MYNGKLVPIERNDEAGVTIYGRVIDKNGRLGQFEVESDRFGNNGSVFTVYKEAKARMSALAGGAQDKQNTNGNNRKR